MSMGRLNELVHNMGQQVIGFDVYGTLVDPIEMQVHLKQLVGERAGRFAELWREKQIEYTFRRGLMRSYENFSVCTLQALHYVMLALDVDLSNEDQDRLLEAYQSLEPFPDVVPAMQALKDQGHTLVAFSNGVETTVRALLESAGIHAYLDDVVSVDDLRTFKPDPDVYHYLARRVGSPLTVTWLVSSNPWDVIGAKGAGLRAAWLKRKPDAIFDPWAIEPDLIVPNLAELALSIGKQ